MFASFGNYAYLCTRKLVVKSKNGNAGGHELAVYALRKEDNIQSPESCTLGFLFLSSDEDGR